jgi:tetratricopeptide (TPR) repeat protein
VSVQPAELRNPAEALIIARRALARAGAPNPVYLHTLGTAQFLLGRRAEAIRSLEQALGLMPQAPNAPPSVLRKQIEADLGKFKSGL